MGYAADVLRSVARYEPAEREVLREFQRVHFGPASRQCDNRVFEWVFERNPDRPSEGLPLWIARRDGAIVGQQGAIPVMLKLGETEVRASWGIDLMVHPAWRLRGIGPALAAAYEDSTDVALGLGISDAARPAYLRRGWSDLGRLSLFIRPLASAAFAGKGFLQELGRRTPSGLIAATAHLAARIASGTSGTVLEPIEAFDERADAIYLGACRDYPVLVKRDLRALRWRYDETPSPSEYARFYLLQRGSAVGYAVLRMDSHRNLRVARIIDYLAPVRAAAPLFALLAAEAERRGAVAIMLEHLNRRAGLALRRLGYVHFADSTQLMVHRRRGDDDADAQLTSPGAWFATLGDSDCDHLPRQEPPDG